MPTLFYAKLLVANSPDIDGLVFTEELLQKLADANSNLTFEPEEGILWYHDSLSLDLAKQGCEKPSWCGF